MGQRCERQGIVSWFCWKVHFGVLPNYSGKMEVKIWGNNQAVR